ncbi:hypothetical protein SPRG_05355 [Saprolegnia parasitica CBS 223.65]|uniref:Palmitoyltransferase n=1 Tax=Saprolegnia parasitica (strain CBS 223.65) TaxID=695850 RepID=A0A067CI34_SAPPC|nr:hypothetical protein SPRG_05355 [Saprolegnia parasitica CBS 223.65]KDO30163.1 hypothetical protein SPRG_05355 [Saprolegnia parasitica CBS 223.65]|eukprot:XP_012199341.1 hypothetical protein SPRG_05355 [Saprolegnia parasitica CBS 223.65]
MTATDAVLHGLFHAMHTLREVACFSCAAVAFSSSPLAWVRLIAFCVVIFVHWIVPLLAPSAFAYGLLQATTAFIVFNIVFNYALCVWTDPLAGSDGSYRGQSLHKADEYEFNNDSDEDASEPSLADVRPPRRAEDTTYCRQCQFQRPRRAHHCSICQVCIDHMDHHCPWINNCVGLHNYRYFCSFLFWLAVGCWYVALLSFSPAVGAVSREEIAKFANVFSSELLTLGPKALMYCVFLIATSAGLLVSFLAGWHFYLVLTAQTSIEYQINRSKRVLRTTGGKIRSPYCRGSSHKNWEAVFGPCRFKWTSLLPSRRPTPLQEVDHDKDMV